MPAQAKMLQEGSRYPGLSHRVGERYQLDLLLAYARKVQGWPIYLLYNHYNDRRFAKRIEREWHMPVESFGISLCDAVYLKNTFGPVAGGPWKIPRFDDLHPGYAVKYYTREALKEDDAFKDLNPAAAIGNIPAGVDKTLLETLKGRFEHPSQVFNPKFRIMFSKEKEGAGLWRMS